MAGVQCENFVGNAWKKDLCLNCFKGREEHAVRNGLSGAAVPRIAEAPKEGILKGRKSGAGPKGNSVKFVKTEFEVIGFGGDDVYSEEEDCVEGGAGEEGGEEEEAESEEERAFWRLTKSNTEYNSVAENLQEPKEGEVKKVVEPLRLGRQVVDEKGNKKTLLVSVTPFGDERGAVKSRIKVNGLRVNGVRANGEQSEEEGGKAGGEKSLKRSQPLDKNWKVKVSKGGEETEGKREGVSGGEKRDESSGKGGGKEVGVEKKEGESKGVVLDVYRIREREGTKSSVSEEKTIKSVLLPPEMRSKVLSSEVKVSAGLEASKEPEKLSNGFSESGKAPPTAVQNGCSVSRSKLIPNVSSLHRHHTRGGRRDGEEPSNGVGEPVNGLLGPEAPPESPTADAPGGSGPGKEAPVESPEEKFKKTAFESLESFKRIIQGEEITLFSAEQRAGEGKVPEISRESAGEPDGRADSDEASEPPALPSKPPPPLSDSRTTFLQDVSDPLKPSDKPKVPAKPLLIHSKKGALQSAVHPVRERSPSLETFADLPPSPSPKPHPPLQESLSSDSSKNPKRQAPKPPSPIQDPHHTHTPLLPSDDSPPKPPDPAPPATPHRICRSTDNLLDLIPDHHPNDHTLHDTPPAPEPSPRRTLSLSHDSLVPGDPTDLHLKKKPGRGRFLLRKLLHLGRPKDAAKGCLPPSAKPKIEIIHPSDLSGSRVEVVPPARTSKSRRSSSSASSSSGEQRESDVLSDSSTSHSVSSSGNDSQATMERAKKPPPPPRASPSDTWTAKPARPPPPKSIDILRQANAAWTASPEARPDNHYVNLGEARSGLAPNKPVRTGSLREANPESCKRPAPVSTPPDDSDYESFIVAPPQYSTPSHHPDDGLYECVQPPTHRSSLPECDSTLTDSPSAHYAKEKRPPATRLLAHRRSDGNLDLTPDYFKLKFVRSGSLPYCSSETESEIYSPYSFYGSEAGDDDFDPSASTHTLRISRLKLKKGRSIVHKSLEDNYGAVIVANHEALAQVVEHMRQGPSPPPALRALTTALNLRFTDFTIPTDAPGVLLDRRVFYPALWNLHPVTLTLMADQGLNTFHPKGPFNLNPLTELNDLVPAPYLPMLRKDASELIQASISVLTRLHIETVETYGRLMAATALGDDAKKEVNFVLLQMINAFKALQAQGIEEAPRKLTNLIVCREDRDPHPRVCLAPSSDRDAPKTSLCHCVAHAIQILPPTDLTPLISALLLQEKAVSLSQAKSVLEFSLWGPADIAFGSAPWERESALQRWLDLERATVLHGLVSTRADLTVFEECQLLFLVRTNAKIMAEASWLLESQGGDVSTA